MKTLIRTRIIIMNLINVTAKRKKQTHSKTNLKFNKRLHKKQKWVTDELLAHIVIKNKMYVNWKTTLVTHHTTKELNLGLKATKNLF